MKDMEKELMSSFSQMLGVVYTKPNGEFKTMSTHIKKPDIQVHQADEGTQRDELNIEQLVNHNMVEGDEQHGSGKLNSRRSRY